MLLKFILRHSKPKAYISCSNQPFRGIQRAANLDEDSDVLPKKARIVICGSGLAGASLAYHLSLVDHGHHTVLLERGVIDDSGQVKGSTSSGLVGTFKHSARQIKLAQNSLNLLDQLTRDGYDINWNQCGSLNVARTHDRMTQFLKMKSLSPYVVTHT
jgi:glycine/D-amino acid oxidase-like deaminating enzyme